jgi:hypothetical protein
MASFTIPAALLPGKELRYPLDRRSGGPQSRSGSFGVEKILDFIEIWTPNPRSSSHYTDWAMPDTTDNRRHNLVSVHNTPRAPASAGSGMKPRTYGLVVCSSFVYIQSFKVLKRMLSNQWNRKMSIQYEVMTRQGMSESLDTQTVDCSSEF